MRNTSERQRKRNDRRWPSEGRRRLSCACAVWLGLGLGPFVAQSAAQEGSGPAAGDPDKIAVMPLQILGDVPAGRPALEAAVMRGLTVASAPTLPVAETEGRLLGGSTRLPCETAECWTSIGQAVEARYLLAGRVERKENLFFVEFQLIDSRPGRLLAREANRCEADDCSVAELCRLVVRELARQTLTDRDERRLAASPPADQVAVSQLPGRTPIGRAPPPVAADRPQSWWTSRRKAGVAAVAGGLAVTASGAFLINYHFKNHINTCADGDCIRLRGTKWKEALVGGIGGVVVGGALAATGVVLLLNERNRSEAPSSRSTRLSLGVGGLVLSGRF